MKINIMNSDNIVINWKNYNWTLNNTIINWGNVIINGNEINEKKISPNNDIKEIYTELWKISWISVSSILDVVVKKSDNNYIKIKGSSNVIELVGIDIDEYDNLELSLNGYIDGSLDIKIEVWTVNDLNFIYASWTSRLKVDNVTNKNETNIISSWTSSIMVYWNECWNIDLKSSWTSEISVYLDSVIKWSISTSWTSTVKVLNIDKWIINASWVSTIYIPKNTKLLNKKLSWNSEVIFV